MNAIRNKKTNNNKINCIKLNESKIHALTVLKPHINKIFRMLRMAVLPIYE